VAVNYRGVDVWELPPNGQGIAALQILQLLEGLDLAAMGRNSDEFWHVFVEAKKLAFADRARFYADPDFAATPVAWLLSDASTEATTAAGHGPPLDSRRYGPVPLELLVGRAWFRYAPIRRIGRISARAGGPGWDALEPFGRG
jgi:gamma-glutamyltranspeptidase